MRDMRQISVPTWRGRGKGRGGGMMRVVGWLVGEFRLMRGLVNGSMLVQGWRRFSGHCRGLQGMQEGTATLIHNVELVGSVTHPSTTKPEPSRTLCTFLPPTSTEWSSRDRRSRLNPLPLFWHHPRPPHHPKPKLMVKYGRNSNFRLTAPPHHRCLDILGCGSPNASRLRKKEITKVNKSQQAAAASHSVFVRPLSFSACMVRGREAGRKLVDWPWPRAHRGSTRRPSQTEYTRHPPNPVRTTRQLALRHSRHL